MLLPGLGIKVTLPILGTMNSVTAIWHFQQAVALWVACLNKQGALQQLLMLRSFIIKLHYDIQHTVQSQANFNVLLSAIDVLAESQPERKSWEFLT